MRFTERQREIIRKIDAGEVFDIASFAAAFSLGRRERYDRATVEAAFRSDPQNQAYYCQRTLLEIRKPRLVGEAAFEEEVRERQASPLSYVRLEPELRFHETQRIEEWGGQVFSFDLYQGVRALEDFGAAVDFLSIWQYLRDEALILDVPGTLTAEDVGLFFERVPARETPQPRVEIGKTGEAKAVFSDSRYLAEELRLSRERLAVCGEFLGRRMYPAPKLKLFIQNRFRTWEEQAQARALIAAWAAVAVSVISVLAALLPQAGNQPPEGPESAAQVQTVPERDAADESA